MLREARIVMPFDSRDSHDGLRAALLDAFGGYTCTTGVGARRNSFNQNIIDNVQIYDVAIEAERDATWNALFQIAMKAGRALGQQAVYIRYPDGTVSIEDVHGREGVGALVPSKPKLDTPGIAEAAAPKVPLGGRRIPAVGEIWENALRQKVAVVRPATKLDGGYDVVVLTHGDDGATFRAGTTYEIDLDGKVLPDKSSHPRNLTRFVKDF